MTNSKGFSNDSKLSVVVVVVALISLVGFTEAATKTCDLVKSSYCKCKMSDGSGYIDFSSLQLDDPYDDHEDIFEYFYNPCNSFTKDSKNCKDVMACQLQTANFLYYDLGVASNLKTWYDEDNDRVAFNYTSQDQSNLRTTSVGLVCDPTVTDAVFTATEDKTTERLYLFTLKHKCACAGACGNDYTVSGLSVGSILLITFTVFLCTYFIIGIIYRKVVVNATGMELIPNLEFWRDIPNLIKDGCCFVRGRFNRGPQYDQI